MECKLSHTRGLMFGAPADANPIEFPLAPSQMRGGLYGAKFRRTLVLAVFLQVLMSCAISQVQAHAANTLYPSMASLDQYLIVDRNAEIALARSAAPKPSRTTLR
jgi:hypothetical protein